MQSVLDGGFIYKGRAHRVVDRRKETQNPSIQSIGTSRRHTEEEDEEEDKKKPEEARKRKKEFTWKERSTSAHRGGPRYGKRRRNGRGMGGSAEGEAGAAVQRPRNRPGASACLRGPCTSELGRCHKAACWTPSEAASLVVPRALGFLAKACLRR